MSAGLVLVLVIAAILVTPWAVRRWASRQAAKRDAWQLIGWRHVRYELELRFKNGVVVRGHHYPSGQSCGAFTELWDRIDLIEKQIEFGQHRELEIREEP